VDIATANKSLLAQLAQEYQEITQAYGEPKNQVPRHELYTRVVKNGEEVPEDFDDPELLLMLARKASKRSGIMASGSKKEQDLRDLAKDLFGRALEIINQIGDLSPAAAYELSKWSDQGAYCEGTAPPLELFQFVAQRYPQALDRGNQMLNERRRLPKIK
jgi:hypothetical protein